LQISEQVVAVWQFQEQFALCVGVAMMHADDREIVCCKCMCVCVQILSAITENITEQVVCTSNAVEHCEFIRQYFESPGMLL